MHQQATKAGHEGSNPNLHSCCSTHTTATGIQGQIASGQGSSIQLSLCITTDWPDLHKILQSHFKAICASSHHHIWSALYWFHSVLRSYICTGILHQNAAITLTGPCRNFISLAVTSNMGRGENGYGPRINICIALLLCSFWSSVLQSSPFWYPSKYLIVDTIFNPPSPSNDCPINCFNMFMKCLTWEHQQAQHLVEIFWYEQ